MPLETGRTIAHYEIHEKLGSGGMGEVYAAMDLRLGREVALKLLPRRFAEDRQRLARFEQEARSASALNHPNIVTIHDIGEDDGVPYIVMERVRGRTLRQLLTGTPLLTRRALDLAVQAAEAIAKAHTLGIIHRDLKPENVMVTSDGLLKVLDFGVAKLVTSEVDHEADTQGITPEALTPPHTPPGAPQTHPGAVLGTAGYMSPEQVKGEAVDFRADQFAMGVVLYEMATGRRAFSRPTPAQTMAAIIEREPVPINEINPSVPSPLRWIVERCLAKDPEGRYASTLDLARELRQVRDHLDEALSLTGTTTSPEKAQSEPWRSGPGGGVIGRVLRLPRRPLLLGVAGLAALAALVALLTPGERRPQERPLAGADPQRIESLAVLPLENLSGEPGQDYFANGMTEAIITELGQIHALRVISRTSVMQYAGARKPIREIAEDLNVDGVLEGSVVRSSGYAHVTARLIDASSDSQLWSQAYERELRDVPTLQREVALAIAREIQVELTPREQAQLTRVRPVKPEAYEAYLRGNSLNLGTDEQREMAKEYYEKAVALDPEFAPGYAGLADYYSLGDTLPPGEAMPKAKAYALKALEIDDTLSHAHTALALIRLYGDWDWAGAESAFERALELNPSDADAHRFYSVYLSAVGRAEEALTQIRSAQELDPLSLAPNVTAGWTHYFARNYDAAIEQCLKTLELEPNSEALHACLGASYLAKGMFEEALQECRKTVTLSGGDAVRTVDLGRAYALAGNRAEARKVLAAFSEQAQQVFVPPYYRAVIHVALGEKEKAFSWLEKAHAERDRHVAWLKVDQALDPLRSDPRFDRLLRRMALSP